MTRLRHPGLLCLGILLLAVGCRQGPSLTYTEVEGTVKLDSQPVPGATVEFYPVTEGKEALPRSTATTDDKGFYRLTCENGNTGAVVGKHRVVVRYALLGREAASKTAKPGIPVTYTVASQSPLQIDVKSGQKVYDLTLKSR